MRNGPPLEMWGAKPPSIKRRGKVILPARGASRSSAPTLVHTSCDGTILAGVFKYSDAIKNPDGKFNYRKRLHPNINEIRFILCSIKELFTQKPQKTPKTPPPQISPTLFKTPKSGG